MKRGGRNSGIAVLRRLADGNRHSGEALASSLGISRAAVWKQLRRLRSLGLDVEATPGSGYSLGAPIDLLDGAAISRSLGSATRKVLDRLEVHAALESTNSHLLDGLRPSPGRLAACLAEYQTGGRGRRGRAWLARFGRGLCLSVAWLYTVQPRDLAALGLAAGVVARRAIAAQTALPIRIKWPNDLLFADRKLGGILVELSAESHGPCYVVVGIGVNVSATPAPSSLDGAWAGGAVDLATATGTAPPSRNALAAALMDGFAALLERFPEGGFADYHGELVEADYLRGKRVEVDEASGPVSGRAVGIGTSGALLIETVDGVREVISGDVSVRPST